MFSSCSGVTAFVFTDWQTAFKFLEAQAISRKGLTVILDEFQRIAVKDSAIESIIQNAWDKWDHENIPLSLVLSGSALSFMSGLFEGDKPTHGRSIYRPLLQPLSFRDTLAFASPEITKIELIERFSVLGGTPQYQRWAGTRKLKDILEDVILSPDAPLYDDPEHLIREEEGIRDPGPYFGTMKAIAGGHTTVTKMAGLLGTSTADLAHYLERLADLSYIKKIDPVELRGKGVARGYWKISDPYFNFWFGNVFPNRSRLSHGRISEVALEIQERLSQITSLVFEDCCREWIRSYSELGQDAQQVGSWWSRNSNVEVDVVAVNNKNYTVIGSCKWTTKPAGTKVLDDLLEARAAMGPKASQAQLVIFSKNGFIPELEEKASHQNIKLVEPDELFT